MRVAVTGGTGFVGRAVCSALRDRGCEVVALTRTGAAVAPGVEVIQGDLHDTEAVDTLVEGVDVVVHAAGLVRSFDSAALRWANVDALTILLERGRTVARVVHVSTAGVHGLPGGCVDEDGPLAPGNPYEASKAAAEAVLRERRSSGSVVVRPTNIVGVSHPLDPLVRFLRAVARGRVWTWSGAWTNYVSIDSVSDTVVAAVLAADPPRVLLVNDPRPLRDFAGVAADALDVPDRINLVPAALARAVRVPMGAAGRRVAAVHRLASAFETTHFETAHFEWFAQQKVSLCVAPTLRAMVVDYRRRGLL